MDVVDAIFVGLLHDEEYLRRALPFLKPEYFEESGERHRRIAFEIIADFVGKYGKKPTPEALAVELTERKGLKEEEFKATAALFEHVCSISPDNERQWLLDKTEDFCKRRAIYLGILETIAIQRGESKLTIEQVPQLWNDALSINFTPKVGHDYVEDADKRFLELRNPALRIPFEIPILNKITRGGFLPGTVNLFVASTHVGKTFLMCNLAAAHMMMGKNVLYLTLEMSETQIGSRIDANLLDIELEIIDTVPIETIRNRLRQIRSRIIGRMIIEQFPTSNANTNHFRTFIDGLRLHKNFVPDIIYIDYLNLCSSTRMRRGNTDSYGYVKSIIEELRGMGVDMRVPIVTATQVNRGAHNASEFDLDSISESWGVGQTADFVLALAATDELREKNQLQAIQLKNRYANMYKMKKFLLGTDFPRMRLYQLEQSAQIGLNRGFQGFSSPQQQTNRLDFSGVQ